MCSCKQGPCYVSLAAAVTREVPDRMLSYSLLLIFVLRIYDIHALNYHNSLKDKYEDYGETWMYIPDGEGNLIVANFTNPDGENSSSSRTSNPESTIHFQLYTRSNRDNYTELIMKPDEGEPGYDPADNEEDNGYPFNERLFDIAKDTKILIHGWMSSGDSPTVINMKDAYLVDRDCNVIIVDWRTLAHNYFYFISARNTKIVGRHTGKMINKLIRKYNMHPDRFHLVGHSLGAHTAGYAGAAVSTDIWRITGLDPALPGFEFFAGPEDRLDKTDAKFVDVIHTCAGVLGYASPLGDADFYPNGGTPSQPGCGVEGELVEACSHARAHQYFTESIQIHRGFLSRTCHDALELKERACSGENTVMGDWALSDEPGVFYLRTNSKEPYSKNSEEK